MDTNQQQSQEFRHGLFIFIILAVLTAGEFLIARLSALLWIPLFIVALAKVYFIMRDYMHISRVFESDEEEVEK